MKKRRGTPGEAKERSKEGWERFNAIMVDVYRDRKENATALENDLKVRQETSK